MTTQYFLLLNTHYSYKYPVLLNVHYCQQYFSLYSFLLNGYNILLNNKCSWKYSLPYSIFFNFTNLNTILFYTPHHSGRLTIFSSIHILFNTQCFSNILLNSLYSSLLNTFSKILLNISYSLIPNAFCNTLSVFYTPQ